MWAQVDLGVGNRKLQKQCGPGGEPGVEGRLDFIAYAFSIPFGMLTM